MIPALTKAPELSFTLSSEGESLSFVRMPVAKSLFEALKKVEKRGRV